MHEINYIHWGTLVCCLRILAAEHFLCMILFLLSVAKCLPRLERILVTNCRNMPEIFSVGGEDDVGNNNAINHQKTEFAQLCSLSLGNLPELTSFCCELKTLSTSQNTQGLHRSLQILHVLMKSV